MHRKTVLLVVILTVISSLGLRRIQAQENNAPKPPEQRKPVPAYHLDFALNELEDGKKINTRQYAMDLLAVRQTDPSYIRDMGDNYKSLKIGTRVPVETEQGKVEYMDIGTSISCRMREDEMGLSLEARAEISSLIPRSQADAYRPNTVDPILRQVSIQSATAITPGKLTALGTVDDPDSKRQFQLEVTVTKLR
ncbi:MAG TPA: hypothetical protein VGS05_16570 [Candidatus Sulfotelmatobacter sp.]|nr:hypothetical protein [Candidatus Sulfotelmatobacter sp.]